MCKRHDLQKWIALIGLVFMTMPFFVQSSENQSVPTLQKLSANCLNQQMILVRNDIFRHIENDDCVKVAGAIDHYREYQDHPLIKSHPDVKLPPLYYDNYYPPMHVAKTRSMIECLVTKGFGVNDLDVFRKRPLDSQIRKIIEGKSDHKAMENLIAQGADISQISVMSEVSQQIFNQVRQFDLPKLSRCFYIYDQYIDHPLVKSSPEKQVILRNELGQTPMHFARTQPVINFLATKGIGLDDRDIYGNSPLHAQMKKVILNSCDISIIQDLVKQGADINALNDDGQNVLHLRLENISRNLERYCYYLRANFDLMIQNNHFKEQCHQAIILVRLGVNIRQRDVAGKTPLDFLDEDINMIDYIISGEPLSHVFSDRINRTRQLKERLIRADRWRQIKNNFTNSCYGK